LQSNSGDHDAAAAAVGVSFVETVARCINIVIGADALALI